MATRHGFSDGDPTGVSDSEISTAQTARPEAPPERSVGRRFALRAVVAGAIAAAGAAVAGLGRPETASATAQLTETATGAGNVAYQANASTGATGVGVNATPDGIGIDIISDTNYALHATNNNTVATIYGVNTGTGSSAANGVKGEASGSVFGVFGLNNSGNPGVGGKAAGAGHAGVYGENTSSGGGPGVLGVSNTTGAASNNGVTGTAIGTTPAVLGWNTAGNYGLQGLSSNGTGTIANVGVYGTATGTAFGIGVLGVSSNDVNSVGLYGQSSTGKGFLGFSLAANGTGAVGVNTAGGIGLEGISQGGSGPGFGVVSSGSCYVQGSLTVTGAKSAAVRDAGGTLRRMYCMESPESWFEDFGSGQLSGGSATVQLEPSFAGVVKTDAYHVFLTPDGETNGLFVTAKTADGFQVKEGHSGTSGVSFSYRVVAKRKDITAARLEPVVEPPPAEIPQPINPSALPKPSPPVTPA